MALHLTPKEHNENPPETWKVVKLHAKRWQLCQADGSVLDAFPTKKEAEAAKVRGFMVSLYIKEGDWFAGKPVAGWRAYRGELEEVRK